MQSGLAVKGIRLLNICNTSEWNGTHRNLKYCEFGLQMMWTTVKKRRRKKERKVCRSKMFIENMDVKANYTTWQSCSFKISCSVEAYTLTDSVTKPTR